MVKRKEFRSAQFQLKTLENLWTKDGFALVWVCGAIVVVFFRGLAAADLGYDLTTQLQAGQNLVAGHGLVLYNLSGERDLAQPERLATLTNFPSAYSLFAAGLFSLGLGAAGVLKAGGSLATILGWWGWGLLASSFFQEGLRRNHFWRWVGIIIAFSTPVLFTPPWQGTDIFLWAAVPWVIRWVTSGANEGDQRFRWFDWGAGMLCGLCFLTRYASVFLLSYAGCLILWQSRRSWRILLWRGVAFAAGVIPFVALQLYINTALATTEHTSVGDHGGEIAAAAVKALSDGFWMLPTASITAVWWMPRRLVNLFTEPGTKLLSEPDAYTTWWVSILLAFAVIAIPIVALKVSGWIKAQDCRAAAVGLFYAVPLFLWVCLVARTANPLVPTYRFVADVRYYLPIIPLAVLVAYGLAVHIANGKPTGEKAVVLGSKAYILFYAAIVVIRLALLAVPRPAGAEQRERLLGTSHLEPWPSTKIAYEFCPSRQYTLQLMQKTPGAVLVTDEPQWFYAEPNIDRSRIHRLGDIRSTYISGPTKIFVLAQDFPDGGITDLYSMTTDGKRTHSNELTPLDNLSLLKRFPAEQMKLLTAEVPSSKRIVLENP
jgi:hypothetical protein